MGPQSSRKTKCYRKEIAVLWDEVWACNRCSDFNEYDGQTVIDILINNTDPEYVTFELDSGWAWRAGIDAAIVFVIQDGLS